MFVRVSLVFLLVACSKTAVRSAKDGSDVPCPLSATVRSELELSGVASIDGFDAPGCRFGATCSDGPYSCRCVAQQGGHYQPNWFTCHKTRDKRDGCPDDATLFAQGPCVASGPVFCSVPVPCGCSHTSSAQCVNGTWRIEPCATNCQAP
jgi:hypothetical protein